MRRYIDADKFRALFDNDSKIDGVFYCAVWEGIDKPSDIQFLIDDQPTADVVPTDFHDRCMEIEIQKRMNMVEVVRCKDCKYWVKDGNESFGYAMFCEHDCSLGGQGIKKPDDFCSYGERRRHEQTVLRNRQDV